LRYLPQRLAPTYRLDRAADKLYERAGLATDDGAIVKRKRMRWRTFNRLMDRANAPSRPSDAMFAVRLAGLLDRLGVPRRPFVRWYRALYGAL
jgi:hypothetical protein